MFFSTYVLTKKGPLAKIWLAAHWDKKLTARDVRVVDLNSTVVQIVEPKVPIALRTSGELMLGCVRIYALKVHKLLKEATDATALLLRPRNVQVTKAGVQLKGVGLPGGVVPDGQVAVTMDLVVGRVGADQLCGADFGGIADILSSDPVAAAKAHGSKDAPKEGEDVIAQAWFAAEASQFQEEQAALVAADVAQLRKDLLAFDQADKRDASGSTSTKKSSLSSIEQPRGAAAVDALDVGLPAPGADLLALGADVDALPPVPDMPLDDPFAIPGLEQTPGGQRLTQGEEQVPIATGERPLKKLKTVQLFDANDTVFSSDQLEKQRNDRHDIVTMERRHGPLDAQEATDRATVKAADAAVTALQPLSIAAFGDRGMTNPALAAAFEQAARAAVQQQLDQIEIARGGPGAQAAKERLGLVEPPAPVDEDAAVAAVPPVPEFELDYQGEVPPLPEDPTAAAAAAEVDEEGRPSKKRGRDADEKKPKAGLSASAKATLDRVRHQLERAGKKAEVKFGEPLAASAKRQDIARAFVDLLVLASHDAVVPHQATPYGPISISAGGKIDTVAATA